MSFDVTEFLTATQQEQEAYRDERQAERKALIEQQDKGIMEYTNTSPYIWTGRRATCDTAPATRP